MNKPPIGKNSGFTLLEVIASVAILGIGILMVIQLLSGSLSLAKASDEHTGAIILAREKMSEVITSKETKAGIVSGVSSGGFEWTYEVVPYAAEAGTEKVKFLKIMVIVKSNGAKKGSYTLTSLKAVSD